MTKPVGVNRKVLERGDVMALARNRDGNDTNVLSDAALLASRRAELPDDYAGVWLWLFDLEPCGGVLRGPRWHHLWLSQAVLHVDQNWQGLPRLPRLGVGIGPWRLHQRGVIPHCR